MTCPDCKGKGGYIAEDGFVEYCPTCDGDGWINSNEPDEFDEAREHDIEESLRDEN